MKRNNRPSRLNLSSMALKKGPQREEDEQDMNLMFINDASGGCLFVGNESSATLHNISQHNIALVIRCIKWTDQGELKQQYKENSVDCEYIPMRDKDSIRMYNVDGCLNKAHRVISDGKNVLIYCQAGRNRSISLCAMYLLQHRLCDNGNFFSTLNYMRRRRPCMDINFASHVWLKAQYGQ